MSGFISRVLQDWPVVAELVFLGAFTAGDASGLLEQLTGWDIEDSWIFLAAIVILGVTSVLRLEGLREEIAEIQSSVRVTASLQSMSPLPRGDTGRTRFRAEVAWEVWVDRDVSTDQLALNVLHEYERPWWRLRRTKRVAVQGVAPVGEGSLQYRRLILASAQQPFQDGAAFEFEPGRDAEGDPRWVFELVLKTGVPLGEYRVELEARDDGEGDRGVLSPR
jgi:hypothetical protein